MRILVDTLTYATPSVTPLPPQASTTVPQQSPWHSPVPYLFGGLAAMLGLIAFALLILACSYWKLSGANSSHDDNNGQSNGERRDKATEDGFDNCSVVKVYEEKIVVIMAGEERPTFLATPVFCSRSGSCSSAKLDDEGINDAKNKGDNGDKTDKVVDNVLSHGRGNNSGAEEENRESDEESQQQQSHQ